MAGTTHQRTNADVFSRLHLSGTLLETAAPPEVVVLTEGLDGATVTAAQITTWTQRDTLLSSVSRCITHGSLIELKVTCSLIGGGAWNYLCMHKFVRNMSGDFDKSLRARVV